MTPSPIVTGSISRKTRATCGSRQSNAHSKWKPTRGSIGSDISSCTVVPASTPIAYAYISFWPVEQRLERDQHDDDHDVPHERRDRRDREVLVAS